MSNVHPKVARALRAARYAAGGVVSALPATTSNYRTAPTKVLFLGENSATVDKDKLARAKAMEVEGQDRDAIWNETGFYRDGPVMRYETDDRAYQGPDADFLLGPMWRVAPHPEAQAAYPEMGRTVWKPGHPLQMLDAYGYHQPGLSGSTVTIRNNLSDRQRRETSIHELQHDVDSRIPGHAQALFRDALKPWDQRELEQRANNARFRMDMTPEQRRQNPPWKTLGSQYRTYQDMMADQEYQRTRAAREQAYEAERARRQVTPIESEGLGAMTGDLGGPPVAWRKKQK